MRILLMIALSIAALVLLVIVAFLVSPRPSAWLVHYLFREGVAVAPENYE